MDELRKNSEFWEIYRDVYPFYNLDQLSVKHGTLARSEPEQYHGGFLPSDFDPTQCSAKNTKTFSCQEFISYLIINLKNMEYLRLQISSMYGIVCSLNDKNAYLFICILV